jgi:glycosyltransferase involved in cell wall biosynthesis
VADRIARLKTYTRRIGDPATVVDDFTAAVGVPSTRSTALLQAAPVARRLRAGGHPVEAQQVATQALELATGADMRALLRGEILACDLDRGLVPNRDEIIAACRDLMAIADRHVAAEKPAGAATSLRGCLDLLLHRTLHCDDLVSPFAQDAAGFLDPLHASSTYRLLAQAQRTVRDGDLLQPPNGRPLRLLFVTAMHWHFLEPVIERYSARDDVDVRRLHIGQPLEGEAFPGLVALTQERLARLAPSAPGSPARPLGPARALAELEWADIVFVEWCDNGALWASLAVPEDTRLIVRLHSVEALSVHPHLVDWARVDDLVLVSAPLDGLLTAVAPLADRPRRHVLPNPVPLAELPTTKDPRADRTLAMIGWSSPVKDPLFALDVLARLRREDPSWRLLLLGGTFPASQRARSILYQRRFEERLRDDLELAAAVDMPGHVEQVARPDYGFILNTSLRESFAVGAIQGTASGAVPVFRDWPVVARYGGPRSIVPEEWVVEDVQGAVDRVLCFADPARRAEEGARARRIVLDRYDWAACAGRYDKLLVR